MTRNPQVGVGAVLFQGDAVLLVRRGQSPGKGAWVLPGGKVELGETLEEAVVREVREETGFTVRVLSLVDVVDLIERDTRGHVRYHYVVADYLCVRLRGELAAGSDVSDARLVDLRDLPRYDVPDKALQVIEAARALAASRRQDTT